MADLTAWLDQSKLTPTVELGSTEGCSTTVLGRDLTLLPLLGDGLELVVLVVLIVM